MQKTSKKFTINEGSHIPQFNFWNFFVSNTTIYVCYNQTIKLCLKRTSCTIKLVQREKSILSVMYPVNSPNITH